jgi:transposase-like protein
MECPYCKSKDIIKNGHAPSGKIRWKCKNCERTFSKVTGKGFPPTSVDFRFINFILHWCKKDSLDKMHNHANFLLKLFKIRNVPVYKKEKISRSAVYKWKKREKEYLSLIPRDKAINYYQQLIRQAASPWSKELIPPESKIKDIETVEVEVKEKISGIQSYTRFLKLLEMLYFKEDLDKLIKDEKMTMRFYEEFKKPITIKYKVEKVRYK